MTWGERSISTRRVRSKSATSMSRRVSGMISCACKAGSRSCPSFFTDFWCVDIFGHRVFSFNFLMQQKNHHQNYHIIPYPMKIALLGADGELGPDVEPSLQA